jgi:hypothetical protein
MSTTPELADLRSKGEKVSADFLTADIELCHTFADLVETELKMGDDAAARSVYGKAEDGYVTVNRLLAHITVEENRTRIANHLADLRTRLDNLKPRIGM